MDYPFNTNQADAQLPVPPSRQEPTSENAPLPIGCTSLDSEEQRMWNHFVAQGKERDRQQDEERQRMKAECELRAQQPAVSMPTPPTRSKRVEDSLTPMQQFQRNLEKLYVPKTAKKLNLAPNKIEELLTRAYSRECIARNGKLEKDKYTEKMLHDVSRWLSAETHAKGSLLLRGYIGVGKTTMLRAIRATFLGLGLNGIPIKSAYEINEIAKDKYMFAMLTEAEFLGIDDLGTEPNTIKDWGNERNPFEELISARYDRMKQTIISTNLVIVDGRDQIAERYGERIADRLHEMCNTINYDPNQKSYRK